MIIFNVLKPREPWIDWPTVIMGFGTSIMAAAKTALKTTVLTQQWRKAEEVFHYGIG